MKTPLEMMKMLLNLQDESQNDICEFYLASASSVICDIRNTVVVESKYLTAQVKIAIELYNKQGVEGQTSHGENGISRGYEYSGISQSLLSEITPVIKSPFSVPTEVI